MVWAHAVGPDGTVTGLEFSPEFAAQAQKAFDKNDIRNIDLVVGPAAET
jgi:predicted O-methyltransferase YrrM